VPALYNGMATAADWMSAASFIGMAGSLYLQGYDGLAFVLGWTGGYVLVAVLVAPYLRKFGAYTVPDFLAARYGGNLARLVGVIVLIACSFIYLMGQLTGTGLVMSRLIGIPFAYGVFVGLAGILVCSMLGGMRAVTWTQVAQYIVLIIAYLIPVIILSAQKTGIPVPQFAYGQILAEITELERTAPHIAPFVGEAKGHATAFWFRDPLNFFGLIFCLMVGTASLPHVIMRYFTTPSVREARKSVGWSLLFIFILYFTAPAYAVFAKYEVFTNILGRDISTLQAVQALPSWIFTYGNLGLVKICGANAASPEALLAACQAKGAALLDFSQFSIAPDTIVLATPEIAGLPYVIAGLVAAGGLAAALSTADGLLLAIANALSHDVYYKMIDHTASTKRRLVVARILLVMVALLGAWTAVTLPQSILIFVSWAFSVAASGLFAALVWACSGSAAPAPAPSPA
jgi:cation/acetate symporter